MMKTAIKNLLCKLGAAALVLGVSAAMTGCFNIAGSGGGADLGGSLGSGGGDGYGSAMTGQPSKGGAGSGLGEMLFETITLPGDVITGGLGRR